VLPRIAEMVRILAQTGKQAEQGGAGVGPR
jgi:hypothetical protein